MMLHAGDTCPNCNDWTLCEEIISQEVKGLDVEVQAVIWCYECRWMIWQDWIETGELTQQELFQTNG